MNSVVNTLTILVAWCVIPPLSLVFALWITKKLGI